MKLLILSQWFPCPPINGAKLRAYHLLKGLSERHEVDLLSFTQSPADREHAHQLESICRDYAIVQGKDYTPTKANAVRAMFSMRPRSSIDCFSELMMQMVNDRLKNTRYDAAIALTTMTAEYLRNCPIPRILDNDNVDTAYFDRLAGLSSNLATKFRRKLTWVKVAIHERKLVDEFDATLTVSEDDKKALEMLAPRAAGRQSLHVVQNGVDLGLMDYPESERDPKTLVSTGALTYNANLDGAMFFCQAILPRIKSAIPDARFVVTGGHKGIDVEPLNASGAKLTGFVDDIRPVLSECAALVVPLRIGGGTRLKILEAMALGTPVISTSLGAAGLGLRHEKTALLADSAEDFAHCAVKLMLNPKLGEELAANAREHVKENFGWERSVANLERVISTTINREKRP